MNFMLDSIRKSPVLVILYPTAPRFFCLRDKQYDWYE